MNPWKLRTPMIFEYFTSNAKIGCFSRTICNSHNKYQTYGLPLKLKEYLGVITRWVYPVVQLWNINKIKSNLLIVDAHPLESQPASVAGLDQEHDREPALGNNILVKGNLKTKCWGCTGCPAFLYPVSGRIFGSFAGYPARNNCFKIKTEDK